MRNISLGLAGSLLFLANVAHAQPATPANDAEYIKLVTSAAPDEIVRDATIVRIEPNGDIRTLKRGTSEFSCFLGNNVPMCSDPNAMEWAKALQTHSAPPDKVGFIYMLNGDNGGSNTDPWATKPEPGNHWIRTGAHVMIVGPPAKTMAGYPRTEDPDPTKPYVMFPGTPYEHLMLPTCAKPST
jgi:hypothetical protein